MAILEEIAVTEPQTTPPLGTATGPRPEATPSIYVACLAAYNNGHLHGRWIKAADPEEIWDAVRAMLADSPIPDAEEWAIHDYEGFAGARISEWASFDKVCELGEFVSEHGELGAKLYAHFGDDLEQASAQFEDYAGEHKSLGEFAEQLHEDTGTQIPEALQHYIDWDALGRDLELGGDVFTIELGFERVHIFWSR